MSIIFTTTLCPMPNQSDQIAQIQKRAIQSWLQLPGFSVKIVICGNDTGYEEFCSDLPVIWEKECPCLKNVPYVGEMMKSAYKNGTKDDIYIWINGDIIVCPILADIIGAFIKQHPDYATKLWGMTGARRKFFNPLNVDIDFNDKDWPLKMPQCEMDDPCGLDIFVHPYNFFKDMPQFVQAGSWHDTFMINNMVERCGKDMSIDFTQALDMYHQLINRSATTCSDHISNNRKYICPVKFSSAKYLNVIAVVDNKEIKFMHRNI